MGMWQGLYMGLQAGRERQAREADREEARRNREEDMAFRREQFERGILEQRRGATLQLLAERRQLAAQNQEAINTAVSIGFQRPAAEALQRSGQLGFVLRSLESQEVAPSRVSAMSEEVMRQLGDRASQDTVAAALLGVVESGADLSNPREAEIAIAESVLNATDIGQLEDLYGDVYEIGRSGAALAPFEVSLSTATVDLPEAQRVRNAVIQRLQPLFGPNTFEITNSGDYEFAANAPADVVNLVTSVSDRAIRLATTPGSEQVTTLDAIQQLTNPIIQVAGQGTVDVSRIYGNLPSLYEQGPDAFVQTMQATAMQPDPIDVPGVGGAADTMSAIADRGGRRAGGVRSAPVEPVAPSAFDFDVNEEIGG